MPLSDEAFYSLATEVAKSLPDDCGAWELDSALRNVRLARSTRNLISLSTAMDNLRKVYAQCVATYVIKKSKTTGYGTTV